MLERAPDLEAILHLGDIYQCATPFECAQNFLDRFEAAAAKLIGEPLSKDRHTSCWQSGDAQVKTYLHPDRVNADFVIELSD